jgi:hypothetical protein
MSSKWSLFLGFPPKPSTYFSSTFYAPRCARFGHPNGIVRGVKLKTFEYSIPYIPLLPPSSSASQTPTESAYVKIYVHILLKLSD